MVAIYYNLIKAGRRTIESVPANLREEVQAMLDADNATT
ncbi:CD1375 family protein [Brevibacillus choshinensis]|nr:CD1375 family protein [Brevibacillus choshinensis]